MSNLSVVAATFLNINSGPSFPPRIKYGVNSNGNPVKNTGFRVKPGMTDKGKEFLAHYANEVIHVIAISKSNQPFLVPEQEGIDMHEYKSMGGDCMFWARKRWHRGRFGILLIVIGVLWFAQRAGWFPSEVFGPIVLLTLGVWMIATSYFRKRQAPP